MPGNTDPNRPSVQTEETPWPILRMAEEFTGRSFVIDLAASQHNAKADRFLHEGANSLLLSWAMLVDPGPCADVAAWLNPPYENVAPWAKKCVEESRAGLDIVTLWPAAICTKWALKCVLPWAKIHPVFPRIPFVGASAGIDRDLVLCHYGPMICPGMGAPFLWRDMMAERGLAIDWMTEKDGSPKKPFFPRGMPL